MTTTDDSAPRLIDGPVPQRLFFHLTSAEAADLIAGSCHFWDDSLFGGSEPYTSTCGDGGRVRAVVLADAPPSEVTEENSGMVLLQVVFPDTFPLADRDEFRCGDHEWHVPAAMVNAYAAYSGDDGIALDDSYDAADAWRLREDVRCVLTIGYANAWGGRPNRDVLEAAWRTFDETGQSVI